MRGAHSSVSGTMSCCRSPVRSRARTSATRGSPRLTCSLPWSRRCPTYGCRPTPPSATRRLNAPPTSGTCCDGSSRRVRSSRRPSVPGPRRSVFQYAIVRIVPRVERGECLNAGVVLLCRPRRFLGARIELDLVRLAALAPDLDPAELRPHLDAIERIAEGDPTAGPIARLGLAERFHWLVAPAST